MIGPEGKNSGHQVKAEFNYQSGVVNHMKEREYQAIEKCVQVEKVV